MIFKAMCEDLCIIAVGDLDINPSAEYCAFCT
jgi:hypothetical protein